MNTHHLIHNIVIVSITFTILSGCSVDPQVSALKTKVEHLEKKLAETEKEVRRIKIGLDFDEAADRWDKSAVITISSQGFQTVKTVYGILTFSIKDIQPYANGCKIELQIGNLLASDLDNITMDINYGSLDEKGRCNYETAKEKNISMANPIRGGYWNNTSIILEGIKYEDFGFLKISNIEISAILLRTHDNP